MRVWGLSEDSSFAGRQQLPSHQPFPTIGRNAKLNPSNQMRHGAPRGNTPHDLERTSSGSSYPAPASGGSSLEVSCSADVMGSSASPALQPRAHSSDCERCGVEMGGREEAPIARCGTNLLRLHELPWYRYLVQFVLTPSILSRAY